jgi:hypothetical protein
MTATSAFSLVLRGSQEGRKVAALAEFGNAKRQLTEPGVQGAVAEAVAVVEPLGVAFMPPYADHAFHVCFHEHLEHHLGEGPQEISFSGLLHQLV